VAVVGAALRVWANSVFGAEIVLFGRRGPATVGRVLRPTLTPYLEDLSYFSKLIEMEFRGFAATLPKKTGVYSIERFL
jgi:hypothetical protein